MEKQNLNEGCSMQVNNLEEENLFLNYLKPDMKVLEYGSGFSTLEIAKRVKSVVSIEHNEKWYNELKQEIPSNVQLHYVPANAEPKPEYTDGTYDDFKDYADMPLSFLPSKFDVIYIDGRARVACAKNALKLLKKGGVIFIHDFNHPNEKYNRPEYNPVLEFLNVVDFALTMYKFKPKK